MFFLIGKTNEKFSVDQSFGDLIGNDGLGQLL